MKTLFGRFGRNEIGGTMAEDLLRKMREEAEEIFKASVRRVDPYEATMKFVRLKAGRLNIEIHGDF